MLFAVDKKQVRILSIKMNFQSRTYGVRNFRGADVLKNRALKTSFPAFGGEILCMEPARNEEKMLGISINRMIDNISD
jgi:hypothetical protein